MRNSEYRDGQHRHGWEEKPIQADWPDGMSADDWPEPNPKEESDKKQRDRMKTAFQRNKLKKIRRLAGKRVINAAAAYCLYRFHKSGHK